MQNRLSIAILGASGYTGAELIRFLHLHPHARIAALSGDSKAGQSMASVYPHLRPLNLPNLQRIEEIDFAAIDCVFCCLPHAASQAAIAALPDRCVIIDLSADFRLTDTALYEKWYGHPHAAPHLQPGAVYGLTELARDAVAAARLIANPGCYPTAAQLPLIPLLEEKRILPTGIIIDAKSGVTGAGRKAAENLLYCEIEGGISAYGVGKHRHTPEIEQGLSTAAGQPVQVRFTPHLIPMARGILSTIYVTLADGQTAASLREALRQRYGKEPFIEILTAGLSPSTHQVCGTNRCQIAVYDDAVPGHAILVCAIDNLVKGASGQAIQNFNRRFGFNETLALESVAIFP